MFDATIPYIGLWAFIVLMVSTPGPANMLLMAKGAAFGFRANIPFMIGLVIGKLGINILIACGFGAILTVMPSVSLVMSLIAGGYLCYLALRSWNLGVAGAKEPEPVGWREGMIVHPLSPKAWLMATLAYSQFIVGMDGVFARFALAPLSFLIAQLVFHSLWCLLGVGLKTTFGTSPYINRGLILITIAVVIWALIYPVS
ncbi:MAG: LysE family translocator [Candidatus Puniceispirillaceae bacterium]